MKKILLVTVHLFLYLFMVSCNEQIPIEFAAAEAGESDISVKEAACLQGCVFDPELQVLANRRNGMLYPAFYYWDNKSLLWQDSAVYVSYDLGRTKKQILETSKEIELHAFQDRVYIIISDNSEREGIYLSDFEGTILEKLTDMTPRKKLELFDLNYDTAEWYLYVGNIQFTADSIFFDVRENMEDGIAVKFIYRMYLDGSESSGIYDWRYDWEIDGTGQNAYYTVDEHVPKTDTSYSYIKSFLQRENLYDSTDKVLIPLADSATSPFSGQYIVYQGKIFYIGVNVTFTNYELSSREWRLLKIKEDNTIQILNTDGCDLWLINITPQGIICLHNRDMGVEPCNLNGKYCLYSFDGQLLWSSDKFPIVAGNNILVEDSEKGEYMIAF